MTAELPEYSSSIYLRLTKQDQEKIFHHLYEYEYHAEHQTLVKNHAIRPGKYRRVGSNSALRQEFVLLNAEEADEGHYYMEAAIDTTERDFGDGEWPFESNKKHLFVQGQCAWFSSNLFVVC